MTEMQMYLPVPEPVTAWQWDGEPSTTEKMLKRWGDKIAYIPEQRHSMLSGKRYAEPHHLRIKRLPNNTLSNVQVGEYIVETEHGIYVSSQQRFEKGYQYGNSTTYTDVSRIEVIEGSARAYVKYGVAGATVAIQDEGRTIKIFWRPDTPDFAGLAKKAGMPEASQAEFDVATNRPLGPETWPPSSSPPS